MADPGPSKEKKVVPKREDDEARPMVEEQSITEIYYEAPEDLELQRRSSTTSRKSTTSHKSTSSRRSFKSAKHQRSIKSATSNKRGSDQSADSQDLHKPELSEEEIDKPILETKPLPDESKPTSKLLNLRNKSTVDVVIEIPASEPESVVDSVSIQESVEPSSDDQLPDLGNQEKESETPITIEPVEIPVEKPKRRILAQNEYIHETKGAGQPDTECACCDFRGFFPTEVSLSSYPEILFFTMNIVFWVAATYMVVMGSTATGWATILRVMRNTRSDVEFDHEKDYYNDLNQLTVPAYLLYGNAALVWLFGTIGSMGIYHSHGCLQFVFVIFFPLTIVAQVLLSSYLLNFKENYCKADELESHFTRHLSTYYNNFTDETNPDLPEHFLSANLIDSIQEALDCCGYSSYEEYPDLKGIQDEGEYPLPHSCCRSNWRLNIFCNYVLEEEDAEYDAKIYGDSGCGRALDGVCDTISGYVGGLTGFIISFILIPPYLICLICIQYNRIAFKMLQIREVVTVEKINLLTPILHYPHSGLDDLSLRRLIIDVDQIKLTDELTLYIKDLRDFFGLNNIFTKRTAVVFSKITEAAAIPQFLLKPPNQDKTKKARKLSIVAGRHNFIINRTMLKYAARVVTEEQDINAYTRLRNIYMRNKMRTLRHYNKRKAKELTRMDASYPWHFHRGPAVLEKKKEYEWLRNRVKEIVEATIESAKDTNLDGLNPDDIPAKIAEYEKVGGGGQYKYRKLDRLRTALPQSRTARWLQDLRQTLLPKAKYTGKKIKPAIIDIDIDPSQYSIATPMESTATASSTILPPKNRIIPMPKKIVKFDATSKGAVEQPKSKSTNILKKNNKVHPVSVTNDQEDMKHSKQAPALAQQPKEKPKESTATVQKEKPKESAAAKIQQIPNERPKDSTLPARPKEDPTNKKGK